MNSYICHDPLCEYCYQMKRKVTSVVPVGLPNEIQNDIDKAGGWFLYRDLVLIENLKPKETTQHAIIRGRINKRIKSRKAKTILT